ncbi:MAG: translation initiation factor IF-2 [Chthoniobacterales bacterium]
MASKVSKTKTATRATSSKRTTTAKGGRKSPTTGASAPDSPEAAEAAAEPKPKAETVSLIEPKKKRVRSTAAETKKKASKTLPPISRIAEPAKPKAAASKVEEDKDAPAAAKPAPAALDLLSAKPTKAEKAAEAEQAAAEAEASAEEAETTEETLSEDGRRIVHVKPPIIVKDLADQLGLKPFQLIADLMELNIFAAINQTIEADVAAKVCEKHNAIFEREKRDPTKGVHKPEPVVIEEPAEPEDIDEDELKPRAPVITFMGHVDHGKTSLLDAIRKSRVTTAEAGGITQHIGAYSVPHGTSSITFLDTPGHAAFTAMRARGASVTDIVVIVVAADDGLMPQTIEAINHAKAANVTIMIAINKCDLPAANPERIKGQLQEHELNPEDWGGDIICCEVSATKGTGIDTLLENMLLQSEVLELKASPAADARCTVIEAQTEPGRGSTATVIVNSGTLRNGQPFICGNHWGKVKQLISDLGKPVKMAGPATPVKVLGLSGLPSAGDELLVMESEKIARALSEERLTNLRADKLAAPQRATLESLFDNIAEDQKKTFPLVLKADVQGTLEAITTALEEIDSDKISLRIIHSAAGPVTESDIMLASASDAVVIGFGVKVDSGALAASRRENIQIKLYSIIYELIDQVKEAMSGLLDPELRETVVGHAEIKQVFGLSRGKVAGCIVTDGRIPRTARARVVRGKQAVYDGGVATLRRFQDEV